MSDINNDNYLQELPFHDLVDYDLTIEFQSSKNRILSLMEGKDLENFLKECKLRDTFEETNNLSCEYYEVDKFIDSTKISNNNLNIISLNIRSLPKHGGELVCLLSMLVCKFQVILLAEIGARNLCTVEHLLPYYYFYHVIPKSNMFGGVGIYISDELQDVSVMDELKLIRTCNCNTCDFESLFINFTFRNTKYTLGGIYRHPGGNVFHFTKDLEGSLIKLDKSRTCIFAGDININIMKYENEIELSYLTMVLSHRFLPHIILPTRITSFSATCIDHIFVRPIEAHNTAKCVSGLIYCDISDHLPCFISLPTLTNPDKRSRPLTRLFGEVNKRKFIDKMASMDWDIFYTNDYHCYINFLTKSVQFFNESFPCVYVSRKRSHDKPWITTGLKCSIRHNFRLYRKSITRGSINAITTYKRYNTLLRRVIKKAEACYHKELFNHRKYGVFNMWKVLGNIVNPGKKRKTSDISKVLVNGKMVQSKTEISNIFNNHFCSVGSRLSSSLPPFDDSFYKRYLPPAVLNSFYLSNVTYDQVLLEIKRLDPRKSPGPDNMRAKVLQLCPEVFAYNLTKIFNFYIDAGIYPDEMKIARVIALYKKGEHYLADNYRPISLLSCFNKIFEKLICKQLLKFFEMYKLFYEYQFGFRKLFSTCSALIETTDSIKRLIDEGNFVLGIFVDLTKAFDTVNHDILLHKMENYGVRGHANTFFRSYLSNRKQYTTINGTDSNLSNINCGVPQGSVLGPILFLIYINDLFLSLDDCKVNLFADDTCVFVSNSNFNTLIQRAKDSLYKLYNWCCCNKLTMNSSKTCFIIFHAKNKKETSDVNHLSVPGISIKRVKTVKYLGVIFDELLSWKPHIEFICSSLLRYFGIFNHVKHAITPIIAKQLYYAFVCSKISYGIEVLGNCSKALISKLQIIQNKLLKLLLQRDRLTPTDILHKDLNILKVHDIYKVNILCFVNKCLLGQCPPIFENYYHTRNNSYNMRNVGLFIPRYRTTLGSQTVLIQGARIWNELDMNVKEFRFQSNFRKCIIKYIVTSYGMT